MHMQLSRSFRIANPFNDVKDVKDTDTGVTEEVLIEDMRNLRLDTTHRIDISYFSLCGLHIVWIPIFSF